MIDPLTAAKAVAMSGMEAQARRIQVVSENLANAQSTGSSQGADPYRRKLISFEAVLTNGVEGVEATNTFADTSEFPKSYSPNHIASDANGFVKRPNVNPLIEMADLREATRGYEANLSVIKQSKELSASLIDLMRSSS